MTKNFLIIQTYLPIQFFSTNLNLLTIKNFLKNHPNNPNLPHNPNLLKDKNLSNNQNRPNNPKSSS